MATIERIGDNRPGLQNVLNTLHQAQSAIESGDVSPEKAIIIFLEEDDGDYDPTFFNAGMAASEMIGLLEVIKVTLLKLMGFTSDY